VNPTRQHFKRESIKLTFARELLRSMGFSVYITHTEKKNCELGYNILFNLTDAIDTNFQVVVLQEAVWKFYFFLTCIFLKIETDAGGKMHFEDCFR
jgi:hypothetical protein